MKRITIVSSRVLAHTGTQTHGLLRIVAHAFVPLKRKLCDSIFSSAIDSLEYVSIFVEGETDASN